jgi:hypothetical protein
MLAASRRTRKSLRSALVFQVSPNYRADEDHDLRIKIRGVQAPGTFSVTARFFHTPEVTPEIRITVTSGFSVPLTSQCRARKFLPDP